MYYGDIIRTIDGQRVDFGGNTHPFAYACFTCRKSFKRPLVTLARPRYRSRAEADADARPFSRRARQFMRTFGHACPQCAGRTHFMGTDFKAPKTADKKGWARVERFIASGRTYYRGTPTDDVKTPPVGQKRSLR